MRHGEALTEMLWSAAKLRAEIMTLRRDPDLAAAAKSELDSARWSAETIGAELVNALAAQTLAEHLHDDIRHVETAAP